jgi:putative tryptophan/tyrosine transport system substrate-binding protein
MGSRCSNSVLIAALALRLLPLRIATTAFRILLVSLAGLVAGPSEAQQPSRVPRLCFLTFDPGTLPTRSPRFDAFFQGLENLGYFDGRTIEIRYLSADNNGDRFPALIDECLSLKPDVIAVTTTPAAQLLKNATSTISIVMVALGDPLGTGLVDNLSKPSGNITGMSTMGTELAVKRLELLRELVPGISRVLVLAYLADPNAPLQVKALERTAASMGITLQVKDFRTAEDIPAAFDAGVQEGAQGVLVTSASIFLVHRARITELAARHKLPALYPWLLPVTDAGGLMAYDAKDPDLHRHAAVYVDRILKGAQPSDLPVQQPTKFQLVINLRAARALGLTIPPTLLARADEVIE